ncbi:MAG: WbqC family protein [Opitutaceae bacterium]
MIVSINQPAYLPWLGYFERIALSDLHVVLDHVQFEKGRYTNRNQVRTGDEATWLTVPLATKGRFGELAIHTIEIASEAWRKSHWATLRQNYGRAPFFARYAPAYEALFARTWPRLAPMLRAFLEQQLHDFGISTPIRYSSELSVTGRKSDLMLELCRATHAETYLSGPLGRNYLETEAFSEMGITVRYHDFAHPAYEQAGPGFVSHLAALDLLFNHGPASREILLGHSAIAA